MLVQNFKTIVIHIPASPTKQEDTIENEKTIVGMGTDYLQDTQFARICTREWFTS